MEDRTFRPPPVPYSHAGYRVRRSPCMLRAAAALSFATTTLLPAGAAEVKYPGEVIYGGNPVDMTLKFRGTQIGPFPRDTAVDTQIAKAGTNPGMRSVYKTNLSGVGIRFRVTNAWVDGTVAAPHSATFTPPGTDAVSYVFAEVIVYGPIEAGRLKTFPTLTNTFTGSCFAKVSRTFTIQPGLLVISAPTCKVTNRDMTVKLPTVSTRALAHEGAAAGRTPFEIGLSCGPGSKVYATMTDANNPENRSSLLTLAADSTARGVGLRVRRNYQPLELGPDSSRAGTKNQWEIGSAGSFTSVPLTVEYVSTGAVSAGSVNGRVTFTLSYQ